MIIAKKFSPILPCLGAALFWAGTACHKTSGSGLPVVELKLGGHKITAEVANLPSTRSAGLMFRKELGRDQGMLFVFPDSAPRVFWMKNTYLPLSIAFLDGRGKILNILEMPPLTEERFASKGPAQFALEMNAGWFTLNNLKAGEVVEGVLVAPPALE